MHSEIYSERKFMKNTTGSNTYYYNQLNKQQQKAYYAMKSGLEALAPSFPVPRLEGKELADIYFLLRMDCPHIF